jgi:hypothetical protein
LHSHFLDKRAMADLLEACSANCGRKLPRREIEAAVKDSEAGAWQPNTTGQPISAPEVKPWPDLNIKRREAVLHDRVALADLRALSPVWLEDNEARTEAIVDALFPGNPLLCVGDPLVLPNGEKSQTFDTKPREDWRDDLANHSLLVPSPMSAVWGKRKSDGKPSKHTLSNTADRRFLVVEFDGGTFDQHATILWHLAGYGPLVLAVHSGSKSLHGWFYCAGQPEDVLRRFMRYAVSLGADHTTWTRSQFVRMPDGTRDNGKRQAVFFFNPKPLGVIK